jgi:hypothetical protein
MALPPSNQGIYPIVAGNLVRKSKWYILAWSRHKFINMKITKTWSWELTSGSSVKESVSGTTEPWFSWKRISVSSTPFGSLMWKALTRPLPSRE